jgi:hypothetical protein
VAHSTSALFPLDVPGRHPEEAGVVILRGVVVEPDEELTSIGRILKNFSVAKDGGRLVKEGLNRL